MEWTWLPDDTTTDRTAMGIQGGKGGRVMTGSGMLIELLLLMLMLMLLATLHSHLSVC